VVWLVNKKKGTARAADCNFKYSSEKLMHGKVLMRLTLAHARLSATANDHVNRPEKKSEAKTSRSEESMVSRSKCLLIVVLLLNPSEFLRAQLEHGSRITQSIDGSHLINLTGSVNPLVKAEFDQGRVNGNTIIPGVSLTFRRSSAQQKSLERLLIEQQDPRSNKYHKWLTPEQFADRFGMAGSDIAKVSSWLESAGFSVDRIARSRNQIFFSGSAARIESVLHTEMHNYVINGEKHFANANELSIPLALGGVILGVRGLDDFRPKPRHKGVQRIPVSPNFTSSVSGSHFLVPVDFTTIYDVKALYDLGIDGSGETIAVIGDSAITMSNIATFRTLSGLPANNPTQVLVPSSGTATVPSTGDQIEAYLDLEWSGAIAKNASIVYVYVGNNSNYSVWDGLQYAVDNNTAPVISISFGYCEQGLGSANALIIQGWAQQANAQGQTISAASGDAGAGDCDGGAVYATHGLAVDIPAAIPEVSGVGGSEFSGDAASTSPTTYWSGTNDSNCGSALIYIPEGIWNDTSESIANGGTLDAGGGGASTFFSKPSWQTGTGVPSDGHRDVPDVSLNASPFHDPFLICDGEDENGIQSCTNGFRDNQNYVDAVGGTSAGAPTFAGIIALLNQATGSSGLGNINSTLYSLAGSASNAFHDIIFGDNKVPCISGSPNCPSGATMGYGAGTGYDQASGLGSVDAHNLVTSWPGYGANLRYAVSASPTSVTIAAPGQSGTSTITVTAANGFSGTVDLSCSPSSSEAKITCKLSPASVSVDSTTTSATATLTIATVASSVKFPGSASLLRSDRFEWFSATAAAVLGCSCLLGLRSRRRRTARIYRWLFPLLLLGSACGGGHSKNGTATGNYTVTVKGTNGTDTRTARIAITVQ
jgi:subtilase family serine protease